MKYLGNMKVQDKEGNVWNINGIAFGEWIMVDNKMIHLGKQVMCSRTGDTVKTETMWYTESFTTVFEYREVKLDKNNIIVDIKF